MVRCVIGVGTERRVQKSQQEAENWRIVVATGRSWARLWQVGFVLADRPSQSDPCSSSDAGSVHCCHVAQSDLHCLEALQPLAMRGSPVANSTHVCLALALRPEREVQDSDFHSGGLDGERLAALAWESCQHYAVVVAVPDRKEKQMRLEF